MLDEGRVSQLQFVSVAVDAQGPDAARRWIEAAQARFPTLIDAENKLGTAFGYKVIPVGILVDAAQTVKHLKVPFSIDSNEDVAAVQAFASGRIPEPAVKFAPVAAGTAPSPFAEGVERYREGKRDEALRHWREALALDPQNFLIRKQIWAVENPDRFYPRIDSDWQKKVLADERSREAGGKSP